MLFDFHIIILLRFVFYRQLDDFNY